MFCTKQRRIMMHRHAKGIVVFLIYIQYCCYTTTQLSCLVFSLQTLGSDVMYELIDDVTLGLCFEVHRACKNGTLFLGDTDPK